MELVKCTHCKEDNKTNAKYCRYCGYELPKVEHKPSETEPQYKTKEKGSKKKLIGIIVGAATFILMYFAVQQFLQSSFMHDQVMMKMASELNEVCPIMADKETRLDNAVALPENTFQYNYTLMNWEKDAMNIEDFENYMTPQVLNNIKTNPDMKLFREAKVKLAYNYKDKNGAFVTKITITPQQYGD